MLMKDVSFWCVVLAIVIVFVVHHILSSFNIIEGLPGENPSLVDQNDESVDNVTSVNNDTMKLNDGQMSVSMSFENDNSRPILNDMNKQSNPLLPISSEGDMNVASSQNATQQRSNGTLSPATPAPVAPATAPTIIIPQQMPGNFTGGLSGNTQTTKEIITPKKNEPSAKELGDAYIEGVKSVIEGRRLLQEYRDETTSETPNETTSETPNETTSETPTETTSETPNETPTETTSETPNETPNETTSETPTETTSETPTETTSETPTETIESFGNFGSSVVPSPNPQDDVAQYYGSF